MSVGKVIGFGPSEIGFRRIGRLPEMAAGSAGCRWTAARRISYKLIRAVRTDCSFKGSSWSVRIWSNDACSSDVLTSATTP